MVNQIISWFLLTITALVQGIAAEHMLETNPKTKRWFRIFVWIFQSGINSYINIWGGEHTNTMLLRNVIAILAYTFMICFLYKGAIWIRIVAIVALFFGMTAAELMMLVAVYILHANPEELLMICTDRTLGISVLFIAMGTCISIFTIFMIEFLWKKFLHRGKTMKYLPIFLVWMTCHKVTLLVMEYRFLAGEYEKVTSYAFFSSTVCILILLIIMFSQSEKETLENELRETKRKKELEHISHREIAKRRERLLKFSMDNSEIIRNIEKLLEEGNIRETEQLLEKLLNKIELTREYPYCGIPIVNVVLWEKKKECDKHGIKIEVNLRLPEQLSIEQMDICSVFSNMLDNAIRACKKSGTDAEIKVEAGIVGKYLIMKCENTSVNAPGKIPEGSGYGLKILKDIANRYEGMFQHEYKNQKYYAQLSAKI